MILFAKDENRWANDIARRIIEERNKHNFNLLTIIEDCEDYAKDKNLSESFRECMAHTAHFLKIADKYCDNEILECAELASCGMMYDNWYE